MMKRVLPYVLIGVLLVLLALSKCSSDRTITELQTNSSQLENQITQLQTENGEWITKAKSWNLDRQALKEEYEAKLAAIPKIKIRKVTDIVEVMVKVRDTIVLKPKGDTVFVNKSDNNLNNLLKPGKIWTHTGLWETMDLTFDGMFFNVNYEIRDSLVLVTDKKTPLFGKSYREIQVYNLNPQSITKTLKHVFVEPQKRFGISAIGGYGVGLRSFDPEPFIGIGLSYSFIRF